MRLAMAGLLLVAAACHGRATATAGRAPIGPATVLYAWNRPERLDALAPDAAAVALYAAEVSLARDQAVWRSRRTPLTLAPGARRIAVIHIEPGRPATRRPLDDALVAYLVERMADQARRPGVAELQLDYEAPTSERPFLRALVQGLRRALGGEARLSMTALASWCLFDPWIAELPVDEAVPMVYRMGRDRDEVRRWLDAGRDFRVPLCRHSVAVSLEDPPPRLPPGRRRFWFAAQSWTPATLATFVPAQRSP